MRIGFLTAQISTHQRWAIDIDVLQQRLDALHLAISRADADSEDADRPPELDPTLHFADGSTVAANSGDGLQNQQPAIALLSLVGVIISRIGTDWEYYGYVDPHMFEARLNRMANDNSITSIVIEVDTPGGTVAGTEVAAAAVREAAKKKRVVAVVNDMACSAGMWIASQATEIVVTGNACVGSIGVIRTHVDYTKMADEYGFKVSYVRSTPKKALGMPYEELTEEIRADWAEDLAVLHNAFVADVARGRKKRMEDIQALATGECWYGPAAVEVGLADRVGTLREIIVEELANLQASQPSAKRGQRKGARSMDETTITAFREAHPDECTHIQEQGRQAGLSEARNSENSAVAAACTQLGVQSLDQITRLAADGQTYRTRLLESLRTECVRTGDDEATANRTVTAFESASLENLEAHVESMRQKADAAVPPKRSKDEEDASATGAKKPKVIKNT